VAATGTPIVLVLVSGRPLAIPREAARASAVLHAWVPGEAGPQAIAEVLFGDVSPGGKLPVTVPRHVGQVPLHYSHKPTGGHSYWHQDYVDGSHLPLWPFGYGLSYSRFEVAACGNRPPRHERPGRQRGGHNVGERAADSRAALRARLLAGVTRPMRLRVAPHLAPAAADGDFCYR
jgi:beta-glucosidase